jgi:hypothetical protein
MEVAEVLQMALRFTRALTAAERLAFVTTLTRLVFQDIAGPNLNIYRDLVGHMTQRLTETPMMRAGAAKGGN